MKELSIEEKAKAYDEAIKRASNLHKDAVEMENNMTTKTCEIIFPELKESEDEKIRKDLIIYLRSILSNKKYGDKFIEDWIAWLEKLKIFTEHGDGLYYFGNNGFTYVGSPIWDNDSFLEKQGEQKSINDTDEDIVEAVKDISILDFAEPKFKVGDVLCDKSCTTLNKESQPNFEITDIRNGMYICDKCSFPISQQDEYELVAKRIEQKPWSEEDESILQGIWDEILANKHDAKEYEWKTYDKFLDWLKSIKERIGG